MLKMGRFAFQERISVVLLAVLVSLGLLFRSVNLDRKVFWVDEVATALRVAGYTKSEITAVLADGKFHTPAELLAYQQLNPERSFSDTLTALQQSPEHAPLYFLLLRLWTQIWGSSITAIRSFSVVCSLCLLMGGYGLSRALFASGQTFSQTSLQTPGQAENDKIAHPDWTSSIMVASLAISPVFIVYAQEARPYSLWLFTLTLSGITLLRALRTNRITDWIIYALALGTSLYTSFLSGCVAIGQGIYVLAIERFRPTQRVRRFTIAIACVLAALLPWLWLIVQRWQTLQDNTTWMRLPIPHFAKLIIWFYSVAILYFDVPVILHPRWIAAAEIGAASGIVAVVIYAVYFLCCSKSTKVWWFVFSLSLPVPLLLMLLDFASNGRYSTAPRYLLPFHLGSQLAIAYGLSHQLAKPNETQRYIWQGISLFIISASLLSNLVHFNTSPRYLKNRNLHNFSISDLINQSQQSVLTSESHNTMDLLSLSHSLNPDTRIQILPPQIDSVNLTPPGTEIDSCRFLLHPSEALKQQIQQERWQLEEVYRPQVLLASEFALSLWQLCPKSLPSQVTPPAGLNG